VPTVAIERRPGRPTRWARTASRRRMARPSGAPAGAELLAENTILFNQVGNRVSFAPLQPTRHGQ
jgi:hypothetical protein